MSRITIDIGQVYKNRSSGALYKVVGSEGIFIQYDIDLGGSEGVWTHGLSMELDYFVRMVFTGEMQLVTEECNVIKHAEFSNEWFEELLGCDDSHAHVQIDKKQQPGPTVPPFMGGIDFGTMPEPAARPCLQLSETVKLGETFHPVVGVPGNYTLEDIKKGVSMLWDRDNTKAAKLFPKAVHAYCNFFPGFANLEDLTEAVELVKGLLCKKEEPKPEPEIKLEVGQVWCGMQEKLMKYQELVIDEIKKGKVYYHDCLDERCNGESSKEDFNNYNKKNGWRLISRQPKSTPNHPVTPENFVAVYKKQVVCSPDCPTCGGSGYYNQYPLLAPDTPKRCRGSQVVLVLQNVAEMKALMMAMPIKQASDFMLTCLSKQELEVTE